MVDYEKGSPAWDIGTILTRHRTTGTACARVSELRSHAFQGIQPRERLRRALNTDCTCGAGDSSAEITSLAKEQRDGADSTFGG